MEIFGEGMLQQVIEAEEGSIGSIPQLPAAMDAVTSARWIEQAMAGEVPVPQPMLTQIKCCVDAVVTERL
jgi:hypothetical protein